MGMVSSKFKHNTIVPAKLNAYLWNLTEEEVGQFAHALNRSWQDKKLNRTVGNQYRLVILSFFFCVYMVNGYIMRVSGLWFTNEIDPQAKGRHLAPPEKFF